MVIAVVIEAYKKIIDNDDDLSNIRKSKFEPIIRDSLIIAKGALDTDKNSLFNMQKPESEIKIGSTWIMNETYDGVIDGIYLEKNDEIQIMGTTTNHILAGQE